jgi:galactose mutarotase-like enzyme
MHGHGPRVATDYAYRGIDCAFLENRHLRVEILTGKGGDVVAFRDKRADVNVLWEAPHNWQPPADRYVPAAAPTTWNDHYPSGWQVNLPMAGGPFEFPGNAYGLHGESALLPWEAEVRRDDDEAVTLRLETELVRYPFRAERELTLEAGEPTLRVSEAITNKGGVDLEYTWQQHVALGVPLLSGSARIDAPARTGVQPPYGDAMPNARLAGDTEYEWPDAPGADGGTVDLSAVPPRDSELHDQSFLTDLEAGWYAVTNPDLDLGFAFAFPTDPFECLWYWQAYGGYHESPFFDRTYNCGLEPTTAYPGDPDAQRANGTLKTLAPGETVRAEFAATTYRGLDRVDAVERDGTVRGRSE